MKKWFTAFCAALLIGVLALAFAGCGIIENTASVYEVAKELGYDEETQWISDATGTSTQARKLYEEAKADGYQKSFVEFLKEIGYNVDLTYYINRSDSNRAVAIQEAVAAAIADYTTWQRAIGRDINPSKLVELVMAAGAKRVELKAPTYTEVEAKSVPVLEAQTIQYGGLEND